MKIIKHLILTFALSLAGQTSLAADQRSSGIVSIGGSLTEIIYALGEEGRLIARDTTSTFPQAAKELPDVGYIRALSPEGVLSVDPKMVIALEGAGPPEVVSVLKSANVPFISIPEVYSRAGIVGKILAVGEALNAADAAKQLAKKVDAELAYAESKSSKITSKKSVLFILSLRGGKVLAAGSDTSADAIIRMAGGINAVTGFSGYKPLTDEAVFTAAPDVILMMDSRKGHASDNSKLKAHAALAATPAVVNSKVIRMNGLYMLGFGPRTADAIRELSDKLYSTN